MFLQPHLLTLNPNYAELHKFVPRNSMASQPHGFVHDALFAWSFLAFIVNWKKHVLSDVTKLSLVQGAFPVPSN